MLSVNAPVGTVPVKSYVAVRVWALAVMNEPFGKRDNPEAVAVTDPVTVVDAPKLTSRLLTEIESPLKTKKTGLPTVALPPPGRFSVMSAT